MADEAVDILGATALADSQENYILQNEVNDALTQLAHGLVEVDLTSADVTYTVAQWQIGSTFTGAAVFKAINNSVYRTITVPAVDRLFTVWNGGTEILGVVVDTETFIVQPGATKIFKMEESAHTAKVIGGTQTSISVVEDHTLTAPPATSPINAVGTAYAVGASATGAWSGEDGNLAVHTGGGSYVFETPFDGQIVRSKNLSASPQTSTAIIFDGSAWAAI